MHVQWDDHHVVNNVPNLLTTGLTHAHLSYREQWAISSAPLKMQLRPRNYLLTRERQHGSGVNAFRGCKVAGNDPRGMMNHAAHSSRQSRDGA